MECCSYIVVDQHTADTICSGCGKVLETTLYWTQFNQPEEKDSLSDICMNANISACIESRAREIMKTLHETDKLANIAFSLYRACIDLEVSRSMKEIIDLCYLDEKSRRKFENLCTFNEIRPSALVSRALQKLVIHNWKLERSIAERADQLYDTELLSSSPQSALAAAMVIELRKAELHNNTIKAIAKACGVSYSCLQRVEKKLKQPGGKKPE